MTSRLILPVSIMALAGAILGAAVLISNALQTLHRPGPEARLARSTRQPRPDLDDLAVNDPDFFQLIGAGTYNTSSANGRVEAIEAWLERRRPDAFDTLTTKDRERVVGHLVTQSHNLLGERDFKIP